MPAITNTFMDTRQNFVGFATQFAAFRCSALLSCRFCQCLFISAEETRVFRESTIRQSGELIQTNVNTDAVKRFRQRLRSVFTAETGKPFPCKPSDSAGFWSSCQGSVNNGFHLPYFGDLEGTPDKFTAACLQLRKSDAVVHATPFQARIACFFTRLDSAEKGLKRQLHTNRNVLENLAVNLFEFGMRLLPLSKARNLVIPKKSWRSR